MFPLRTIKIVENTTLPFKGSHDGTTGAVTNIIMTTTQRMVHTLSSTGVRASFQIAQLALEDVVIQELHLAAHKERQSLDVDFRLAARLRLILNTLQQEAFTRPIPCLFVAKHFLAAVALQKKRKLLHALLWRKWRPGFSQEVQDRLSSLGMSNGQGG